MRIAARIVEKMHDKILEVIEPGMRKNELVAQISDRDHGCRGPRRRLSVDRADAAHRRRRRGAAPDLGRFADAGRLGHLLRDHRLLPALSLPTVAHGYLGRPPKHFIEAEKAIIEGIEAGLDAAKPGNTCEHIANAFFAVLKRYGIDKSSRCGCPIGASYPPDWGERTMSLRPGDTTVLEPGMTFHFMPGLWQDDWGLEITESILITPTGVEPCATRRANSSSRSECRETLTDQPDRRPRPRRRPARLSQAAIRATMPRGCGDDPDHRGSQRQGPHRLAHRRQPWRRVRGRSR